MVFSLKLSATKSLQIMCFCFVSLPRGGASTAGAAARRPNKKGRNVSLLEANPTRHTGTCWTQQQKCCRGVMFEHPWWWASLVISQVFECLWSEIRCSRQRIWSFSKSKMERFWFGTPLEASFVGLFNQSLRSIGRWPVPPCTPCASRCAQSCPAWPCTSWRQRVVGHRSDGPKRGAKDKELEGADMSFTF